MKRKIISLALSLVLIFSVAVTFTGCGDENYPVEIANITVETEPKNIVVLDPLTADIISYMGYDYKLVGRSDEVNQEWLSAAPSVGAMATPDVEKIKSSEAEIVFAGELMAEDTKKSLSDSGIQVITMSPAKSNKQLQTNYLTIGKILGGRIEGGNRGVNSYEKLIAEMESRQAEVKKSTNADGLYTVCYIYSDNNSLKLMTRGTYGDMLLGYTGLVNAAVNIEENQVDVTTLKMANPSYIFYSDFDTLRAIKRDPILSQLTAIKTRKSLLVSEAEMSRQGKSAINALDRMIGFVYPSLKKQNTSEQATTAPTTQTATTPQGSQPATTATTTTTTTNAVTSVASKYKIKLDNLTLKYEDENANVKAMQKRLYDLGYVEDADNVTGYYGDVSKKAVSDFQKKNGIKSTGNADNKTLVKMFEQDAVKAN